jgi:hypothetical protein
MISKKEKFKIINSPWVQCPAIPEVDNLVKNIQIPTFHRGSGKGLARLNHLEKLYREWVKDIVDLDQFPYCYFVNGVTDALNQWMAIEHRSWQYLEGDYEYPAMISGRGTKVKYINSKELLYISNPACSTGNFIEIKDISNPVILDCAYIGSTEIRKMFVPKNTEQIFFSFSKGWGLIGQRAGLVFTKNPHDSLDLMKNVEAWNYTSVEIAISIVENFSIDETYKMYKYKQEEVCKSIGAEPSDCFFIGNSSSDEYAKRRRINSIARLNLCQFLQ